MAKKDEQLLSEMQDKSYTVDSSTGRVVSDPSKFTLLDAQQHYNRIHGLEGKGSKQSRFNKKSSLAKFADITLEDIANNPKKFVDALLKVKGNQQTILQDVRLILSEAKYTLPAGPEGQIHPFTNVLPNMAPDDGITINFFQGLKSTPDKTYANLAIIDEPENVRSFFMGLDKYADVNKVDTPVVDAIKFGANTGFRPSLITELKMKEIHVFEKGTPNEHYGLIIASDKVGAKDSDTKKGGTKKARTFRVPLNDEASAIVRERMAIAEQLGLGPNDNIFFSGNQSSITTEKMNDVLARVEIDGGIIEDLDDPDPNTNIGKTYNTLHIDKKNRPKSGSQLLRNVHTHLATRAGVAPEMIDFLQGRISEQAIHQRLGYLVRHSRASFDPKILNNIKKFTTYYEDIGAPQTFYAAGSAGNEQAKIEAEAKRKEELLDTEKRQTIKAEQKGRTTEAGKKELKNILMEKYGYSDAEADAAKHNLINVARLESLEEYVKDKPNLKLDTLEDLDSAMRQQKLDQSSRPVVGPMNQLLAESKQQEVPVTSETQHVGGQEAHQKRLDSLKEGRQRRGSRYWLDQARKHKGAIVAGAATLLGPMKFAKAAEIGAEVAAEALTPTPIGEPIQSDPGSFEDEQLLQAMQSKARTADLTPVSDLAAREARTRLDTLLPKAEKADQKGRARRARIMARDRARKLETGLQNRATDLEEEYQGFAMRQLP